MVQMENTMGIRKFRFYDIFRGWGFHIMPFSALILLVGKSGVGKTNILNSSRSVRNAAVSGARHANGGESLIRPERLVR